MARGVNKAILIGNMGSDPTHKTLETGQSVSNVSIACTEQWKNKQGEKQERTEWVPLVFWGGAADTISRYGRKGTKIYVDGRLQTRSWETPEGEKKFMTEVIVQDFTLLDSRTDSEGDTAGPEKTGEDLPF